MAAPFNNGPPPPLSLRRANAHNNRRVVPNTQKVATQRDLSNLTQQIGILPSVIPSTTSITGNFAAKAAKAARNKKATMSNATMSNATMPNATMSNVNPNGGRRRSRHAKKTRRNKRHAKKTRRHRKH